MTDQGGIRVRVATVDDAPRLLPLFEAFYGAYFEPKSVEAIREHMATASAVDTLLLAEDRGLPVGFASVRLIPQVENGRPHAELSDLFVEARHRRRGIGRALVASAEALARERGSPRMCLVTSFDNGVARDFYRAVGYGDHALQMQKDLGEPR